MKVHIVGGTNGETVTYTKITDIEFAPDADMTNMTLPINDFECTIQTEDEITVYYPVYYQGEVDHYGQRWIEFEDDAGNKYFQFVLTGARRLNKKFVRVRGESILSDCEKLVLEPIMYNNKNAKTALQDIVDYEEISGFAYISNDIGDMRISGFCPEQTARERIQWICFVLNLKIKQVQTPLTQYGHPYNLEITPFEAFDSAPAPIESDETYYKPTTEEDEVYTKIVLYYYSYEKRAPQSGEKSVKVYNPNTGEYDTYVLTESKSSYTPPSRGGYTEKNVLKIKDMYLVDFTHAPSIMSFLANKYCSDGVIAKGEIINNNKFKLLQRVLLRTAENSGVVGYISKENYTLGAQIKTDIELDFCRVISNLHNVTLIYTYKGLVLKKETFAYPYGFSYNLTPKYVDRYRPTSRTVYYPPIDSDQSSANYGNPIKVTGTVGNDDIEHEIVMSKALYYNNSDKKLELLNMSDSLFTGGVLTVAHKEPKQYRISVTTSPRNGGSVSGSGLYNEGVVVTLNAVANTGYVFDFWKDGQQVISESTPLSLTVVKDKNLVAQFREATQYTVEVTTTGSGTVTGAGTYYEGDTVTLTATPASGYTLTDWVVNNVSVGSGVNPFTLTTDCSRDYMVRAVFEQE